ncbi:MAG TPA: VWA domain-containing protein [Bryobacteraceae bacterium]|nr:VWA domain-containing protein [Bryobacteraceae bacterium]
MSLLGLALPLAGETDTLLFHSDVQLVGVNFTVKDAQGNYVQGLKLSDIGVFEDGIKQQPVSFSGPKNDDVPLEESVFVLMDTSNGMYEDSLNALDALSGFLRNLNKRKAVAVYTFSRNLHRSWPLARGLDRPVPALQNPVVGDDTAIFNSLLLTIRDAAKVPGNKTIVLLASGADTASILGPGDVARVAREEGIPIHIVFRTDKTTALASAFESIADITAGRAYAARTWKEHRAALNTICEELNNSYTVAYHPKPNENAGFRSIRINVASLAARGWSVKARPGYKPITR